MVCFVYLRTNNSDHFMKHTNAGNQKKLMTLKMARRRPSRGPLKHVDQPAASQTPFLPQTLEGRSPSIPTSSQSYYAVVQRQLRNGGWVVLVVTALLSATVVLPHALFVQRQMQLSTIVANLATGAWATFVTIILIFQLRHLPCSAIWLHSQRSWLCSLREGVTLDDSTVILRRLKCKDVYLQLELQPVRILRSPPESGKSSLATLLVYNKPFWRLCYIVDLSGWHPHTMSFENYWMKSTGETLMSSLDPCAGWYRTYIVDEAQKTFDLGPEHEFWGMIKRNLVARTRDSRVQVLLLGVYCAPLPSGANATGAVTTTPVSICDGWSLSYLGLSDAEIFEFFALFNSTCVGHACPCIPPTLQRAIIRVCGNHVGLLRNAVLAFGRLYRGHGLALTNNEEASFIRQELLVLGRSGAIRAIPSLQRITTNVSSWIQRTALAGPEGLRINLLANANDDDLSRLLQIGVFDLDSSTTRLHFSSRLMQTHALQQLFGSSRNARINLPRGADAADFARAIIKRMDSSTLSYNVTADGTLLERQYQMSFFA